MNDPSLNARSSKSVTAKFDYGNDFILNTKLKGYFESMVDNAKEMICLEPTMNGKATRMCFMAFTLFALYSFLIITNVPKPHYEEEKGAVQLIISTTVFGTLLFQYTCHALFSTHKAQRTSAVFGATIACIAGLSHSLHLFGAVPKVVSTYGQSISLIQFGEWMICVPSLVVAIGHVLCINRTAVLYAAASQGLCIIFGLLGSIIQNKVGAGIMLFISEALLLPFLFFLFIFCFKLPHLISPTQQPKIRAIGYCTITLWNLFPIIFVLGSMGFLSNVLGEHLLFLCDLLSKALFLAIVLVYQFQDTLTQGTARLVTMEKASAAQKVFLRFVFHEVRVPFQSLLLGIQQLQHEESLNSFTPLLDMLMSSAEMMNRVINDVLSLSRLQDGQLKLEPVAFSLEEVVSSTIWGLNKLISEKGVSVIKEVDDNIPAQLYGDPIRLSQILANLLSNAIKFTPSGKSIQVAILVTDQNERCCFLCLEVQDQGIGISEKDQKRLFTPYSQINPHQNQAGRGSGLGLSIVKHLVELMGGTISLKSEVGKGSEFSVKLKLPVVQDKSVTNAGRPEKLPSTFTNLLKLGQRRLSLLSSDSHGPISSVFSSDIRKDQHQFFSASPAWSSSCSRANSERRMHPMPDASQEEGVPETKGQDQEYQRDIESVLSPVQRSPVSQDKPRKSIQIHKQKSHTKIFPSSPHVSPREEEKTTQRLILVVDDSQSNRKMASMVLKKEGYQVEEAENGSEAVAMVKKKKFDLILMDNVMPIMDGVEATKEILKLCRNTKIVGLTGNCLEEDIQEFMKAGASKVLIKPCDRTTLVGGVSCVLNNTVLV
mmetsp:Transcript_18206/g.23555  ORF Transcript_18206/g.23555 Transcript_18206/m.23555 type:complete len:825 (-) Transcript_18206:124-2598(-)